MKELYCQNGDLCFVAAVEFAGGDSILPRGPGVEIESGVTVRPFTMADFQVLAQIDSFLIKLLNELANRRPMPELPSGLDSDWRPICYLLSRPFTDDFREDARCGRVYFERIATEATDHWSLLCTQKFLTAIGKQLPVICNALIAELQRRLEGIET